MFVCVLKWYHKTKFAPLKVKHNLCARFLNKRRSGLAVQFLRLI